MILCIVINTIILSLDKYPANQSDLKITNQFNDYLTWIFTAELTIKLTGLGFKEYVKDKFNIFDGSIVCISIAEKIIESIGIKSSTGGAISALRAVRLLRIFRLAKSWNSFKLLLEKAIITLKDISNFSVLMVIFMFIYNLLGLNFYAYKVILDNG
jgi:hypothetical protein